MKVVIVNAFETYDQRVQYVYSYFQKNNEVIVINSDFEHIRKKKKDYKKENEIYIEVISYKKNLSIRRMLSHNLFARKALKKCIDINADLIYVLIPPNSLVKQFSKLKKKKNFILIYDVIDLWPETMPIGKIKSVFPFTSWKGLRDKWIKYADYIFTECKLYNKFLPRGLNPTTIYFCKKENLLEIKHNKSDKFKLCYLGSINNIIDIDEIIKLIMNLMKRKKVLMYVIGDGENKEVFLSRLKLIGAEVRDEGIVYDDNNKQKIFNDCDFGRNLYKKNTCIGVTMKSLDYLKGGLPIINNICGDTFELVEKYNIGINYNSDTFSDYSVFENQIKRDNVYEVYNRFFSENAFINSFDNCFDKGKIRKDIF